MNPMGDAGNHDLSQAQILTHIAHLTSVGTLPAPVEVRFAERAGRRQVHITVESPGEAQLWAEPLGAEESSGSLTTLVHWLAVDWHGWIASVWAPTQPRRPVMTPGNLARALLES